MTTRQRARNETAPARRLAALRALFDCGHVGDLALKPRPLADFTGAFNRHDVDAVMSFMTEDCVFESSAGPDVCGTRYVGRKAVRAGFAEVWTIFPDAHWGNARRLVQGDRGVSEWAFSGTRSDGSRVEVHLAWRRQEEGTLDPRALLRSSTCEGSTADP